MSSGEEHARRALAAADQVVTARVLVGQADHALGFVINELEDLEQGTENSTLMSAVNGMHASREILIETMTLLGVSADRIGHYVDVVAPGLRRDDLVHEDMVPGDQLLNTSRRARSAREVVDEAVRQSGKIEDIVKPGSDAVGRFTSGLQPIPPGQTTASTSHPVARPAEGQQTHGHPDPVVAAAYTVVALAKGVQAGYDATRRFLRRGRS